MTIEIKQAGREALPPATPQRYERSSLGHGTSSGIWRFRASLPAYTPVTLGEGSTAMLPLSHAPEAGERVYAKQEHRNPTGSFKDRGSALVAAAAIACDAPALALASTGNAGASMAAYAALVGRRLMVFVPRSTDPGKLWQMTAHGAEIRMVDGEFSDCEKAYRDAVAAGAYAAGSDNDLRQEGTKTIAFEIFEELARVDRVIAPAGTGGLAVSLHMGFQQVAAAVPGFRVPAIDVVQLEALNPFAGLDPARKAIRTAATGINIANPSLRDAVMRAVHETHGLVHSVSEEELLAAQDLLAKKEGLGAEPTGSVTTAAYKRARREGRIRADEVVVVIVTGHILKAPVQIVDRRSERRA